MHEGESLVHKQERKALQNEVFDLKRKVSQITAAHEGGEQVEY